MSLFKKKKITKKDVLAEVKNILLVLCGCAVLAFGDAAFLVPCNIISGGVSSLAIIVNYFVETVNHGPVVTDIVIAAANVVLWLVGLFTLGFKFSIHTLLGSLAYPVFYSLMLRFDLPGLLGITSLYEGTEPLAVLILAGIFGGALVGTGVSLAYLGNGSTGGFDVISFIIAKHTDIKQDVSSFVIDSSLILVGIICLQKWDLGLVGILGALACALMIQYIYIYSNSYIIVDIISDKYDKIQQYVHKELDHATTIIDTIGGYTGAKRKMMRVVIYKYEMAQLRNFIAVTDPRAFVSFMQAKTINGEGFEPFTLSMRGKKRLLKHYASKAHAESKPTPKP